MRAAWLLSLFILVSLLIAFSKADDTITFYIASDGNDTTGDGSSGSPYASLNGAIAGYNALVADNNTGDVYNLIIKVKEGTYTGFDNTGIVLPAINITIQNDDAKTDAVFFDCQFATANAFTFSSGSFNIYYLNFQNCQTGVNAVYPAPQDGQDVYIYQSSFVNMTGRAVYAAFTSSMKVQECTFSSPAGLDFKNYIFVLGNYSSGIDILDSTFTNGVGPYITGMNGGNIIDNDFTNMTAPSGGDTYALYIQGGTWDIEQNAFTGTVSSEYATVNLYADADTLVANYSLETNSFTNNVGMDGVLFIQGSSGYIKDCTFDSNLANIGGAIFVRGGNVTIEKSKFENNNATLWGGAIDIEADTFLFLYDNDFENNLNDVGSNATANSLSCCHVTGADCSASYYVNNDEQGDFATTNTCKNSLVYVSTDNYFESLPSYQYQQLNTPSGSSLWWVWLLVSLALIATIVVVGIAVGAFIYTKKKRSYESFA